MVAPTIEGQLICASNVAFHVKGNTVAPCPQFDAGSGLVFPATGVTAGSSGIDAALVGRIPQGVVLAFRGSLPGPDPEPIEKLLKDWFQVIHFKLVCGNDLPGQVHEGFLRALDALWEPTVAAVLAALDTSTMKHLYLTGHSAGGALAHMAAARLMQSPTVCSKLTKTGITVVSFAAPKFADEDFRVAYEKLAIKAVRYENRNDIAPHIPPSPQLLAQLGAGKAIFALSPPTGYVSTGELRFINWGGAIVTDSPALKVERLNNLMRLLAGPLKDFLTLRKDHLIDCIDSTPSGYLEAVYGALKCLCKPSTATPT